MLLAFSESRPCPSPNPSCWPRSRIRIKDKGSGSWNPQNHLDCCVQLTLRSVLPACQRAFQGGPILSQLRLHSENSQFQISTPRLLYFRQIGQHVGQKEQRWCFDVGISGATAATCPQSSNSCSVRLLLKLLLHCPHLTSGSLSAELPLPPCTDIL